MASAHEEHHVSRILDNFAATTLAKYFQSLISFVQACHSLHIDLDSLTPVQLADGLFGYSGYSFGTILRWDLSARLYNPEIDTLECETPGGRLFPMLI
jgi:hypothetical protein